MSKPPGSKPVIPKSRIKVKTEKRSLTPVSSLAYQQLLSRLDMPQKANERLRKTMQTPPPWDRE